MILPSEWLILIFLVIILFFGAQKLPELAKAIGRAIGEFERGRREIEKELRETESSTPTTSAPTPRPAISREKLIALGKDLGIQVEGKTDEELRKEIAKAISG